MSPMRRWCLSESGFANRASLGWRFVLAAFVWVAFAQTDAEAIPNFSRKYDMDCSHCHVMVPKLNKVGLKFHDNFTLKEALGDLSEDMRDRIRSEDPEDLHPAYWPISIRAAGGYAYNTRKNQVTDDGSGPRLETLTTNTFALKQLDLLLGGLLRTGISYYITYYPAAANVDLPGQPPIHAHSGGTDMESEGQMGALGFAWVRFADIFGQFNQEGDHPHDSGDEPGHDDAKPKHEHGQDLILGNHELHLTLSGHHRLTNAPYLAYRYDPRAMDSAEGFALDAPQLGASLDGSTPWFGYAVSLYNGTSGSPDNNRALDVFATITQEFGDHRFGIFGLRGTAPTSFTMEPAPSTAEIPGTGTDNRPFLRFGADADLNFGPFNLMVFGLYGQADKELFGTTPDARTAKFYAGFVEGDYMIESARTMLIARYDLIRNAAQGLDTNPNDHGDADAITLALRRDLVLISRANLQLHVEATSTRTRSTAMIGPSASDQLSNTGYLGLDVAF